MEPKFWHDMWERNHIGFHQPTTNPLLARHLPALRLATGSCVFVPLCGKSLDVHYLLEQGHRVVGVELSPIAVRQLFVELGLKPGVQAVGALDRYESDRLTVYVGDLFHLQADTLGPVDAVYDRAALIALPSTMRDRYVPHLVSITKAAAQLLVCLAYDAGLLEPPPHSVDESEVRRRYGGSHEVALLERHPLPDGLKGKQPVYESIYRLQKR